MHPIVTLFLLFAGLGALLFLWLTHSALVLGPLAAIRAQFGLSDGLVVLIVGGLIALFIVLQFVAIMRKSLWERQADKRMRERMKAPVDSQYTNRP